MALMDETAKAQVAAAIERAEATTAGEIVVAWAARSDEYGYARGLLALAVTVVVGLVTYECFTFIPPVWIFAGQALVWLGAWKLSGTSVVLRAWVPRTQRAAAVTRRAQQLFVEKGLTETRDRSGILILVSEAEHRVEILGDRGIHQHLGTEGWAAEVHRITLGLKAGKPAEGLCQAIESLGAKLAAAFPRRADDQDELPNAVIDAKLPR